MTFVTRRPLETTDTEQDYKMLLDVDVPMIWAYRKGSGNWRIHEDYGFWSMKFSSTGDQVDSEIDMDALRELLRDDESE